MGSNISSKQLKSTFQLTSTSEPWLGIPGRGGYLVYLSDGDVPFFRVSFSPIFSRTGYQKKASFLEQVVKTCQKRNFVTTGYYLVKFLCF